MAKPFTVELPPEVAARVSEAARAEDMSEAEWIVAAVLQTLPSNVASEVEKLRGLLEDDT